DVYSIDFRYPGEHANKEDALLALKAMKQIRGFIREKLGLAKLPKGRIPARAKKSR
ncbi:MAG: hypothetical protein HY800_03335, partial [Ignavibacteriales bacterium]|nr:hypothetical protein [Ignavibacteriales bacterium]